MKIYIKQTCLINVAIESVCLGTERKRARLLERIAAKTPTLFNDYMSGVSDAEQMQRDFALIQTYRWVAG